MKFTKNSIIFTIGLIFAAGLLILPSSDFGFALSLEDENVRYLAEQLIESQNELLVVSCAMVFECSESMLEQIDDYPRSPENKFLTDGEIFEKMILDNTRINDKIESLNIDYENFDVNALRENPDILNDEEFFDNMKKIMDLYYESLHSLSPLITELQFRGYVFNPMLVKDQECLQVPTIQFPEIEIPDENFSDTEFLHWSHDNKQKITQYNEISEWYFGVNFDNIPSEDDKKIIEKIKNSMINFEDNLLEFEKNPTQENLELVKESLFEINQVSTEYEGQFILIELDVSKDHKDVIITTSIETSDSYDFDIEQKCLQDFLDDMNSEYEVQNIDAQKSQLAVPISFPTLEENHESISPQEYELGVVYENLSSTKVETQTKSMTQMENSKKPDVLRPKQQKDMGFSANDVMCEEGLQLILKESGDSFACVLPNTAKKLVERGWGISPSALIEVTDARCWSTAQAWRQHHIDVSIYNLDHDIAIDTEELMVYVDDKKIKPINLDFSKDEIQPGDPVHLSIMYEEGEYTDHVEKFRIVKIMGPANTGWDFWVC